MEPEVEITSKPNELATRFKRISLNCDHDGHVPTTPDIARRRMITGIQDGDTKPEVKITFEQ